MQVYGLVQVYGVHPYDSSYAWVTKKSFLFKVKQKNQLANITFNPTMKHFYTDGCDLFQDDKILIHRAWGLTSYVSIHVFSCEFCDIAFQKKKQKRCMETPDANKISDLFS